MTTLPPLPEPTGNSHNDEPAYSSNQVAALIAAHVAAERERMLSMPSLMHACDAVGVPANGEYCELLRNALVRA